jgi:hypothetical protein
VSLLHVKVKNSAFGARIFLLALGLILIHSNYGIAECAWHLPEDVDTCRNLPARHPRHQNNLLPLMFRSDCQQNK